MTFASPQFPTIPTNLAEGIVIRVDGRHAWVDVRQSNACSSCDSDGLCGSGMLGLAGAIRQYRVLNTIGVQVGQRVMISLPHGSVFKAAILAYLLPLMLALAGAFLGLMLGNGGDFHVLMGLLGGLVTGWLGLRFSSSGQERFSMQLIRSDGCRSPLQFHPISSRENSSP